MADQDRPDDIGKLLDEAQEEARSLAGANPDNGTKSVGAATAAPFDVRARAHAALDVAIEAARTAGPETFPVVNLTTLTDELRGAGVPMTVGRHGRPAHYGRPAAAERARGAAPFGEGTRVRLVKRLPSPQSPHVPGDEAEVQRVYKRGDAWLCAVEWLKARRPVTNALPVDYFELATDPPLRGTIVDSPDASLIGREGAVTLAERPPGDRDGRRGGGDLTHRAIVVVSGARFEVDVHPSDYVGDLIGRAHSAAGVEHTDHPVLWHLRKEDGTLLPADSRVGTHGLFASDPLFLDPEVGGGAVPSMSERKSRGEARPPWWGTPPPIGTRRRLIADVLRAEDVLSETEVREFADAIELALLEVGTVNALFGLDHDGEVPGDDELPRLIDVVDANATVPALDLRIGKYPPESDEAEGPDYKGWIEPLDKRWLIFLRADGGVDVHHRRDEKGAVLDEADASPPAGIPPEGSRERGIYDTLLHAKVRLAEGTGAEGFLTREHVGILARAIESMVGSCEAAPGLRDGELRIVLEPIPGTEEMRFVELEDGNCNSVAFPMIRSERDPFSEIVIPPPAVLAIGDGLSEETGRRIAESLETLTTSAGGALRELLDRSGS